MSHPSRVHMTGPLAVHQVGLWSDLLSLGYARFSARNLLRVAAHLSRWLQARHLSPPDLTADRIDAFLRDRRAAGYTCWRTPKGLEPILRYLWSVGAAWPPDPPQKTINHLVTKFGIVFLQFNSLSELLTKSDKMNELIYVNFMES